MDKNSFLEQLRRSLLGQVPDYEIESNIRYYSDYISSYGSGYEDEQRCIDSIGDPRLIAKTIIDAYEVKNGTSNEQSQSYDSYYEESGEAHNKNKRHVYMNINGNEDLPWYRKVLLALIPISILAVVLFVGIFIFRVVLRIALPVILILLIARLITRLYQK